MRIEALPNGAAAVVSFIALLSPVAALSAAAPSGLDAITSNWPELNLSASLDVADAPQIEQGASFRLRISADDEAHIVIVLLGSDGRARVKTPRRPDTADRISRGTEMLFPDVTAGESLYADMPEGKALAYVLASDAPIFPAIPTSADESQALVEPSSVVAHIHEMLASAAGARLAVERLAFQVIEPALRDFVSAEEFAEFYAVGTRSVRNADLGFRIGFALNSAQLDPWSRKQLDAVGSGMLDARLSGFGFTIEGHTDDLGTEEYNMDLSIRRAKAVRDYLGQRAGVEDRRLTIRGFGESQPRVASHAEEARAENRRVVIRRQDKP